MTMKKTGRFMAMLLVMLLTAALLAGCGSSGQAPASREETVKTEKPDKAEKPEKSEAPVPEEESEEESLPESQDDTDEAGSSEAAEETGGEAASQAEEDLVDGMHRDFKEAMDSYESFMMEYCDFMEKYNDDPANVSFLADYAEYMLKYAEFAEKFDKWESEDLNDTELAYYLQVQARVTARLAEVGGEI